MFACPRPESVVFLVVPCRAPRRVLVRNDDKRAAASSGTFDSIRAQKKKKKHLR